MTSVAVPTPVGAPFFAYRDGVLHVEDVALPELAARHGSPLYVYSRAALRAAWQRYAEAIEGRDLLVCYGMKANSNLAILREFARLGAGFDIVSGGELARVIAAGGESGKVVFSGVGKQAWEMRAALAAGVLCFNVESQAELRRLSDVATAEGRVAPVSLRVNPDVDPKTHPYISTGLKENKFGIAIADAPEAYRLARDLPGLRIVGVDCHIGSQITEMSPYLDALDKLIGLLDTLRADGIRIHHLDIGGGLGIRYQDETPLAPKALVDAVAARLQARGYADIGLVMEPGRSLVGNAGLLLTQVEYLKPSDAKHFAIVDAAMNDLLRPTLYDAYHGVLPVVPRAGQTHLYDVVGPVCESGDWLAKDRELTLAQGDLLAIESAGAYGMVMASQYNTRARAAEVLVDGHHVHVVRERETVAALFAGEAMLPD
ncbi:diaminopimelate decarboxylase [Achromobacter sp. GG226]|uniref:diaminopimelate decarboxylase n=1 Tax=Verticiella alkaliphila TaxID=2779529 RepID=UPI001C0ACB99|nr:diaminopimelate decarboxylase [Verticiella sp. GG226]MBU4612081.1 diaminopimelate decarboxylase [Verticiella sp. GG226]